MAEFLLCLESSLPLPRPRSTGPNCLPGACSVSPEVSLLWEEGTKQPGEGITMLTFPGILCSI